MAERVESNNSGSPLVTEVHLQLTRRPPVLAYVSVTLWGCVAIHDLRLLLRQDETRVLLMPRQQASDGTWSTIAHPIREEVRAEVERKVLYAYECALAKREAARASAVENESASTPEPAPRREPAVVPARAAEV